MRPRANHYIKPNEGNRIPRRHVFLDCEVSSEFTDWGQRHTFRLACARFYSAEAGRRVRDWTATYDNPNDLWEAVSRFAGRRSRTIVWSHNLGIDVRLSEALSLLPGLGWELSAHNLSARGNWFVWRRDEQSLVFADSASVFSQPLPRIGAWFGMGKIPIPADCEDKKRWEARCQRNVEILSTAVLAYLEWLERADMGNWSMTGAGQGWNAFRHNHLTHNLLVHTEKDALAAERRAMWTGRNEAYWHGEMKHATILEYDFHLAYATIARDYPVPVRIVGEMPARYRWSKALDNPRIGLLCEGRVTTDTPVVPTSHNGRIIWPTGTFDTTLWDPEIRTLLDAGGTFTPTRGWLYRTEPALQHWAEWIIAELNRPDAQVPAWQKDILKHWCRTVVGRPAMQFTGWEVFAYPRRNDVARWDYYDPRNGERAELLQVGKKLWKSTGLTEWSQSMPMITGYVMSLARVRLWELLSSMAPCVVLYADTDSILVNSLDQSAVEAYIASGSPIGLRLKRSYEGVTIWGPRQIVTGPVVRISGVAHGAERTASRTFTGQIWESVGHAVKSGNLNTVEVTNRTWNVRGVDNRRVEGQHGWTFPVTL